MQNPHLKMFRLAPVLWAILSAGMAVSAQPPPASSHQFDTRFQPSSARRGANEWGLTAGGAFSILGGTSGREPFSVGLRWGHVLTSAHGPGPLLGTLEYAVEVVPTLILQQSTNVYGGGITPLMLQYNFVRARRIVPFIQAGAGILFTNQKVPEGTSQFNFTPQGGIGAYIFRRSRMAVGMGARYQHISNAGITRRNPGRNSLYFYTGISWWR